MNWQLNKIQYPVYNLGEGKRIGIWVQGCSLGCIGCINPSIWNKKGGKTISIIDLFNWIATLNEKFDGITVSGGEPFLQYEQLIVFLHLIKTKTTLNVHCFTGYYLTELNELFSDKLFYKYIDYLVDGRYIEELHENHNIKGSLNQTLYKFIDNYPIKQNLKKETRKWSINIRKNNKIYMAGIPKKNELNILYDELSKVGFQKKFR